ncbi:TonB-dependent receptor [Terrimonas pollutisoli]|uniref:TonB-dependent receptor n=1 Tax=Terrimonas pollutisoli TaxID=3034147 RepID=UPI0023EC1594|nr:TonB-dependent receptor [Terrimonas sp. H1YJ31]
MKPILTVLTLFIVQLVLAQDISFRQTIKGTILDEQSGNALSNVSVILDGPGLAGDMTDSLGNFKLKNVPIGRQTIRISLVGYEEAIMRNIEVTSSKEVVLEIKLKERIKKLDEITIKSYRQKNRALNETAVVSARQFSVDEAVRYSGTRNDPSRMAQNFAGVSGSNDARNDIIIRGNSPSGVLWRMEGIDIPNPNHYSTLGSTGGPVTILNTNTLKNSDFITSAFPAQYGNAIAGVFDLRMRNGNNEKYEFLGQMGFNGFEFGAEGPLNAQSKSSFLVNYRYSMIATIQKLGLDVGTGSATPYYQDVNFKVTIPTKKAGTFSLFGLGGESHIKFAAIDEDNLYSTPDGSLRERNFRSWTGVTGFTHHYFFNPTSSGKFTLAVSGFDSKYREDFFDSPKPDKTAFYKKNTQLKYSAGYTFNKKFNPKNQLTAGIVTDFNRLKLRNDYIPDGDSVLITFFDSRKNAMLAKSFINFTHRFSDKLSSNLGVYHQLFTLNNTQSIEPRWNLKYQLRPNQSFSIGAGLHSQTQPLEVYFYETKNNNGQIELTNKDLDFVKSLHGVLGYDINFSKHLRLKAEIYGQYIYNAAVEKESSSFSMLNAGADFYFPDKTNLVNEGKGYNYGVELTLERFLDKGFYYLITTSVFESKYKGSDAIWHSTVFNSNFVMNLLAGKEFRLNQKASFGVDTKLAYTGGQRYTPFDLAASQSAGYIVFRENEAYSLQNDSYLRLDLKLSFNRNGKRTTQKWYIDLQNLTNRDNIYMRTLNPKDGTIGMINQIGFFPNINYQLTF